MTFFDSFDPMKLISRKIWVAEMFFNFQTCINFESISRNLFQTYFQSFTPSGLVVNTFWRNFVSGLSKFKEKAKKRKGRGFDSRLGDRIQYGDYERIDTDPGCILDLMEEKVANVENCKILCLNEVDKLLSHEKV